MAATAHKKDGEFDWTGGEIFFFSVIGLGAIAVIWIFAELLINLFI